MRRKSVAWRLRRGGQRTGRRTVAHCELLHSLDKADDLAALVGIYERPIYVFGLTKYDIVYRNYKIFVGIE